MPTCDECALNVPSGETTLDRFPESGGVACRVFGELALLHSLSETLGSGLELREAVLQIFDQLRDTRKLERGLLLIHNRENGELVPEACAPPFLKSGGINAKISHGLIGGILTGDRARAVPAQDDALNNTLCNWEKEYLDGVSAKESLLVVPIRHGQELAGALCFTRTGVNATALEADLRFLTLVSGQVGLAVRFRQLARERQDSSWDKDERLRNQIRGAPAPADMIGKSSAMRMVHFLIDQVANGKTTVLIRGETGTGKERIAQAIWQGGTRRNKPFVRVNCAALPESIIESELFGHEKGAFTGAFALRKGRFELAHNGTLFLDEIGEISLSTQAKLLRVLQEGVFERVGGSEPVKVDVRVIAATNRNLEEMLESGKFRLDLYYRINVFPIYVPPLRERHGDLLELATHFLEKYSLQNEKRVARISTPAIDLLMAYHWPGNVRELENVIERAVLLTTDEVVHSYLLPPTLQTPESSGTASSQTLENALNTLEREMIVDALKDNRGIMSRAARQLGITERVMGLRVKALNIRK